MRAVFRILYANKVLEYVKCAVFIRQMRSSIPISFCRLGQLSPASGGQHYVLTALGSISSMFIISYRSIRIAALLHSRKVSSYADIGGD